MVGKERLFPRGQLYSSTAVKPYSCRLHLEQTAHRVLAMDPLDRLGQEAADREGLELRALGLFVLGGDAVGGDDAGQLGGVDALDGRPGEYGVRAGRGDRFRAFVQQRLGRVDERAGRVDDVIDDEDVPPFDL